MQKAEPRLRLFSYRLDWFWPAGMRGPGRVRPRGSSAGMVQAPGAYGWRTLRLKGHRRQRAAMSAGFRSPCRSSAARNAIQEKAARLGGLPIGNECLAAYAAALAVAVSIFVAALAFLYAWKNKLNIAVAIIGAGVAGWLLMPSGA